MKRLKLISTSISTFTLTFTFTLTLTLTLIFAITFSDVSCVYAKTSVTKIKSKARNIADTIIKNGTIYTVDANNTIVEAVAIKDEKIIFVGKVTELKNFQGENTKIIDLKGAMLLPGMIDSHIHSPGTILTHLYSIDLNGVLNEEETIKTIRNYVITHSQLPVYYGAGFSIGAFSGEEVSKGPRKERLDEISSNKAIVIRSYDGHSIWLNSKAFEQFGITKYTKTPEGGVIEKDENGELWGVLKEAAIGLVPSQRFTEEQIFMATKKYQQYLHSLGYTGITSMSGCRNEFIKMDKSGELKMYVNNAIVIDPQSDIKKQIQNAIVIRNSYNSANFRVGTLKFFADGVVEGVTAYLLAPYAKEAGKDENYRGTFLWDMNELKHAFVEANTNKFQIHVHSVGDGSTKNVLDALEYANANINTNTNISTGRTTTSVAGDFRNAITHLQLIDAKDFKRFAKLKVVAITQPYWAFKEPKWWEVIDSPFLAERAEKEYPMRSFLNAGVVIAASSDHSVTPIPNPFWAIEVGVTRNLENFEYYNTEDIMTLDDPKWLLNPEERVSVKDMIRAFTINGAYQNFLDKVTGSIEVGKNADMIIIDRNILTANPITIDSIKVLKTIFNGKVVYER